MKLDDFKQTWQQQQQAPDPHLDRAINAVRSRMTRFNRVVWLRDLRE